MVTDGPAALRNAATQLAPSFDAGGYIIPARFMRHLTTGRITIEWGDVRCPKRIDVTPIGAADPVFTCGCGHCHQPRPARTCCRHDIPHSDSPGIGCPYPGCLCLNTH